jgi:dTDP-4-dehydrorhamnose 3,5-epimerase
MIFKQLDIKGSFHIQAEPFEDDRGVFRRNFCEKEFKNHGIISSIEQANISENKFKNTLRGFHYQHNPHGEGKTMTVLSGSIYDIIVDLRRDSETYLKWVGFELTPEDRTSFHIPPGCANAFLTLEDNTLVHYYCSHAYVPQAEGGIRFNDPLFKFSWPNEPEHISEKDSNWPDYSQK